MPGRVARSSINVAQPKTARNKNRKRHLDAFAIAGRENPEKIRIRQHRLGESLDDEPRTKRRRAEEGDEDSDTEEQLSRQARARNVSKKQRRDEDSVEEGSDSDGNEWTLGGLAENDEDSDLDSEEAFGSSDEERFEGFTFRGSSQQQSKKRQQKPKEQHEGREDRDMADEDIDLDESGEEHESEDGEEEDDDFGEDGVDLAAMLDDDDDEEQLGSNDHRAEDIGEYSGSDDEDDGERDDEERRARMLDMANDYGGHEAKDKNEKPLGSSNLGQLSAADLLGAFEPEVRRNAEKGIKPKKRVAGDKLSAPLPKRQQDKLEREIASKKATEELDRWRDTVIQNRRAEFLQFPLRDPNASEATINRERFAPAAQEVPRTDLEANIQMIMEESGLASSRHGGQADIEDAEAGLLQAEELGTNKLPVEEVQRRTAELKRQRELLFREEIKAKRINKIKSKAYRRVHRRERQRQAEADKAFLGSDDEMDEGEKERADRKRAEARMSTKHKDSKWAKTLKATNRTVWDDDARDAVMEQARRQEELKRRIAGDDVSEPSSSDVPEPSDDEDDNDDEGTLKKLERLRGETDHQHKGLGAMKFMQAADAKRKARNDEDVEQLRKDLAAQDGDVEGSEEEDEELGRAIFGPRPQDSKRKQAKQKRAELEEGSASDEEDGTEAMEDLAADKAKSQRAKSIPQKKNAKGSGPLVKGTVPDRRDHAAKQLREEESQSSWLQGSAGKKSKKKSDNDEILITQPAVESEAIVKKSASNGPVQAIGQASGSQSKEANAGRTDGWTTVAHQSHEDEEASDDDAMVQPMLTKEQQTRALQHRAFAGDDVHLAFSAEKAAAEESEDEKEVSNHLPGWGSWTGDGLSKRTKKQNARLKHNPLHKAKIPGVIRENRRDKGREDVIISEKGDKKGSIYKAKALPHGFETKEQWERSLRVPLGPEWTTKEVFQRNARPRVVVKPGTVVEAMERPLV